MITTTQINVTEIDGYRHSVNAVLWQPNLNKNLPLVIFCHGVGEAGTDVNKLFWQGLPKVLKEGYVPPFDFVMIAMQRGSWSPPVQWCTSVIEEAYKLYGIDKSRVYLTGLSAGGNTTYLSQFTTDMVSAEKFAAIAPLSAANADIIEANAISFVTTKTPVWSTCGQYDNFEYYNAIFSRDINAKVPGLCTYTKIPGIAHSGWADVYKGITKDASDSTIWDFFKNKVRGGVTPIPPVVVPSVIVLPTKKLVKTILIYDDFSTSII